MSSPNAVSMSMTTALIYGMSGGFFFLLVFLLVLMGMTNCAWNCSWCRLESLVDFNSMKNEAESEESLDFMRAGRIYNKISHSDAEGRTDLPPLRDRGLIGPTLTLRRGKERINHSRSKSVLEKNFPLN